MTNVGALLRDGATCDRTGSSWRSMLEFHEKNLWIYDRLTKICNELWDRGFRHYSMRTIICVLRFEWDVRTTGQIVVLADGARAVKLNDHHSPYYARMLIEEKPTQWWDFFELRDVPGDPVVQNAPPLSSPPPASMGVVPLLTWNAAEHLWVDVRPR
jgi:hypothetical protein